MKFAANDASIRHTAMVAGVFSAIVGVVLVVSFLGQQTQLALDHPEYQALKLQLEENPTDAETQAQLHSLDAVLRQRYFQRQAFLRRGAFLLAGGIATTLLLAHWATTVRRRLPHPKPACGPQDVEVRSNQWAQWATAGVALILLGVVVASKAASSSVLPDDLDALVSVDTSAPSVPHRRNSANTASPEPTGDGQADSVTTTAAPSTAIAIEANQQQAPAPSIATTDALAPVSWEQFSLSWPRFRGLHGSGTSSFDDIPTTWDGVTGKGIRWKIAIPLPGVSSPIVWQDRIFLTGATQERREVYSFATDDGRLLWQKTVGDAKSNDAELKVSKETGFAAPTPTTDGQRVYALFARGDLVAFDFEGKQLWYTHLGPLKNPYGHASSLTTFENLLIIQLDQGNGRDNTSKLIAIHGATGEVAWETPRAVPTSWTTPIIVQHAERAQIITSADPWVIGYAAADGRELWRAECMAGEVGVSPVYGQGMVYVANESARIAAIDVSGEGDVTESHVRWTADYALPDICSPLVTDRFLLLVTSYGSLASYDRETGGEEPIWEEDLDGICMASPSRVGDRVYLITDEGKGSVIQPNDTGFEKLAENDLGEPCFASPAFQPGRIYVRGAQHLFCIGEP